MSNLGQLNERLKHQATEKRKETESLIREDLQTLSENLRTEYKSALNTISADIRDQSQSLSLDLSENQNQIKKAKKTLLMAWIQPPLIALLICIVILGSSWGAMQYLTHHIQSQLSEIRQNDQKIMTMQSQINEISLSKCDNQLCAQIDLSAPEYQNGYRILKKK